MARVVFALFFSIFVWAGEVAATRIFHKPLEQVLTDQTPVILAQVNHCQVEILPNVLRVSIGLRSVRVVHLRGPACDPLIHQFSTQLERTSNGSTVRVSPIREGSGLEQRLEVGQSYYFLLDASGQFVLRAEPESAGQAIRQILLH